MVNPKTRAVARNLLLAVAVVVLALGSSVVTALEVEPGGRGLFSASGLRGSMNRAGEPTTIRTRYVDINLDLLLGQDGAPLDLAPGGNSLTLNLFDDTVLVAVIDRVEPNYGGGFTWTGQVQDEPLSLVTLVVNDGVTAGTVLSSNRVFEIGYAGNGGHAVSEIDQSAFPPEAEPIPVFSPEGDQDAASSAVADDGSVIDVMVVYTPAARSAVGGTTAMISKINLAVSETNQSYSYSGITQRLNLVHAAEVSYTETTFDAALDHLTNPSDGQMDNVHTLRDTYHADEVVLIINNTQYCGLAWLMATVSPSFESYAFAVVDWRCATGYYSFGHELGHNMGAHHDRYAVTKYNQGSGAYWYSYGYVNTTSRWRTIMAYNDACSDLGFNCTRIQRWSNPNVTYGGVPTGASDADNHRTLNNTALTVANFRLRPPPSAPTNLAATVVSAWQVNLSWTDTSSNETGFRIERSIGTASWSTLATVSANTTSYADTTVGPNTTYYYRVIAYNASGDSAASNTASATTPPSAPTNLVATPLPPWQISLSWTDTSSNETGFRIERRIGTASWSTLATVGANTTSYVDTNTAPETTYSYRVIAYNASGDSAASNTASATLPEVIGPLVYDGYSVDDGNGLVNCGDTVALTVVLFNEGNTAVEGINSTLSTVGGTGEYDVASTGNMTSAYPNIGGGATAGNYQAFEFEVIADAKHGHWIDFELAITASNWSGGPIEFSLPILCSATADYRSYLPVILK